MIEVNRKILLTVLALSAVLLATPYISTVMAGKGQEKLSIRFVVGSSAGEADPGRVWMSPHDTNPYAGETNALHYRDSGWGVDSTGFLVVVDEGGANEETFDDEDITYTCSYDINMFFSKYPEISFTIKVSERWEIAGRGYIETLAVEYVSHYGTRDYSGQGNFVGHGEIDGQKIVLSGEAGVELPIGPFRMGTVMGWP